MLIPSRSRTRRVICGFITTAAGAKRPQQNGSGHGPR